MTSPAEPQHAARRRNTHSAQLPKIVPFGSTGVLVIAARPVSGRGTLRAAPTPAIDGDRADGVVILLLALELFTVIGIAVRKRRGAGWHFTLRIGSS